MSESVYYRVIKGGGQEPPVMVNVCTPNRRQSLFVLIPLLLNLLLPENLRDLRSRKSRTRGHCKGSLRFNRTWESHGLNFMVRNHQSRDSRLVKKLGGDKVINNSIPLPSGGLVRSANVERVDDMLERTFFGRSIQVSPNQKFGGFG